MHNSKPIAQGLASLGRGPDTELVHMTRGEVHGLQQLAMSQGGSLTINPHTGLVEAGFLSSILPMVAGAVANYYFPGSGMYVGAALGAATNKQNPLMGGLMGGISGYGSGNLASGFENAGLNVANAANTEMANQSILATNMMSPEFLAQGSVPSAAAAVIPPPTDFSNRMTNIATGVAQAGNSPMDWLTNPADKYANATNTAMTAAPLIYAGMGLGEQPTLGPGGTGDKQASYYNVNYSPGTRNPRFGEPGEPYFVGGGYSGGAYSPTYRAAAGGQVPNLTQRYPQSDVVGDYYGVSPQSPGGAEVLSGYGPKIDPFTGEQKLAVGGIAGLQTDTYAAGGRLLRGDGDGVSDSIPAVIQGARPQRAALADGEFVLPARIVSEIGNGSTEAGARKLYAMMDKIQERRRDTLENVATDSKSGMLLPA